MLAVAVECRPLDCRRAFRAPIIVDFSAMVADHEVSAFECRWEADDQGTNLACRARGVDMSAKKAGWA